MLEGRGWLNGISLEHALVECGRYRSRFCNEATG